MTTPAKGVGVAPMGVAPYGYGTPATAPTPGGGVHLDVFGQPQGSLALSLAIDSTGQYVFNSLGRRVGMPDVSHMVILAVKTLRGSCVVTDLGQRFFETRKVLDTFVQDQKTRVQECLQDLVDRNLITIDEVTVQPNGGMPAVTRVRLTDLTTKNPIEVDF